MTMNKQLFQNTHVFSENDIYMYYKIQNLYHYRWLSLRSQSTWQGVLLVAVEVVVWLGVLRGAVEDLVEIQAKKVHKKNKV